MARALRTAAYSSGTRSHGRAPAQRRCHSGVQSIEQPARVRMQTYLLVQQPISSGPGIPCQEVRHQTAVELLRCRVLPFPCISSWHHRCCCWAGAQGGLQGEGRTRQRQSEANNTCLVSHHLMWFQHVARIPGTTNVLHGLLMCKLQCC